MFVGYTFINGNELEKLLPKLNKYNGELPFVLFDYIDKLSYFDRVSDDVKAGFFNRKHDIQLVDDTLGYLEYDLKVWVEQNPEFKKIYIKQED